jgi:hypothetical protein
MTEEIKKNIQDIFKGADERNWKKIEDKMAGKVLLDYTSMTGGEPALLSPEDITKAWANFLPGFDKTEHNITNFKTTITDKLVTVTFDGKADHFIDNKVWTVEGDYYAEVNTDNKVCLLKFNFKKQSGDTELPSIAGERMQKDKTNK